MSASSVAPKNEDVLAVIRRFPNGATLEQIEKELSPTPQRRMLQYCLGLMEEQKQISNVGTTRAPLYRCANSRGEGTPPTSATTVAATVAPSVHAVAGGTQTAAATVVPSAPVVAAVRQPMAAQSPAPATSPVVEQRLGATAIGVNQEQVNDLADLLSGSRMPPAALKMYVRQAAIGLPNPNEFVAAVEAEIARRRAK